VLIGPGALNVTVILPESHAHGLSAIDVAQNFVVDGLARAIRRMGPPAEVRGLGDLTLEDRKFGGSAQRRLKSHFMVHCSLLYDFPLDEIGRYLAMPGRQPAYRAGRDHDDFVCNLNLARGDLVACITSSGLVAPVAAVPREELPLGLMQSLASEKYRNRDWTERF
jgi:lipoate-protein ligase A